MEGSSFTVKDIVLEIREDLKNHIKEQQSYERVVDQRIDELEQHRASITSNFKLAAWIIGSSGGLAGAIYFISMIK